MIVIGFKYYSCYVLISSLNLHENIMALMNSWEAMNAKMIVSIDTEIPKLNIINGMYLKSNES